MDDRNSFCSWSGGKDSCLALYKCFQSSCDVKFLLTMCIENGERSRSHGLSLEVLKSQARALGIPLLTQPTSWQDYRRHYIDMLVKMKRMDATISNGIFGDIDIEENGQWEKDTCAEANFEALLPLWKMPRQTVLQEFLDAGFQAKIVAVDANKLSARFLGRTIDLPLIQEFESLGIDTCGENGEYHTVVVGGPLFHQPLNLKKRGAPILRSGYWYQDFYI